jgi:hypothetical protein
VRTQVKADVIQEVNTLRVKVRENGVGAWECWNVKEKEKAEIGNVDKIY